LKPSPAATRWWETLITPMARVEAVAQDEKKRVVAELALSTEKHIDALVEENKALLKRLG